MATVIDSLLIELGLDTSKFTASQKKAVDDLQKFDEQSDKTFKHTQKNVNDFTQGLGKTKDAILSLGVAVIGLKGLTNLAQDVTKTNADIGRTSELFGMSARELSAWQNVMKTVGGDADDFNSSLQSMQQSLASLQTGGGGEIFNPLAQLGVPSSAIDIQNAKVDVLALADAIKKTKETRGEQVAYGLAQQLGISRNFFMVLQQGSGAVKALYDDAYKHTGVTKENTDKAIENQKAWAKVSTELENLQNQLASKLIPVLTDIASKLVEIADKVIAFDKSMNGGLATAILFAGGLLTVVSTMKTLAFLFPAVGTAGAAMSLELQTAIAAVILPMTKLLDVVMAVKTGLAAVTLMLYSSGLNTGEDEEMKRLHDEQDKKMGITRDANRKIVSMMASTDAEILDQQKRFAKQAGMAWDEATGKVTGGAAAPFVANNAPAASGDQAARLAELEKKYGLPAGTLDKMWATESSRGANMGPSSAGATGHFQFTPGTAAQYGMSVADTYDFNKSSEAAARYMADLMKKYDNDLAKALAAYNWGPGNVDKYGLAGAPNETRKYLGQFGMGASVNMPSNPASSNTSVETNIQNINVQTQATNADGIVKDIKRSMENNQLITYGIQGVN